MTIKQVFQAALNEWEWEDEIEYDESDDTDIVKTSYSIDEKRYSFVMWSDERRQWISISVKSPLSIPDARRADGALLLNYFNSGMSIGKFTMGMNDGYVYYSNTIDIEGTEAVPMLFSNMRIAAASAFGEQRFSAIAAVAYTKQKLKSIIDEFAQALNAPSEDKFDESQFKVE